VLKESEAQSDKKTQNAVKKAKQSDDEDYCGFDL